MIDLEADLAQESILLDAHPIGVAFSQDGGSAYVAAVDDSAESGEIAVVDITSRTTLSIPAAAPYDLVVDPGGTHVYVTDFAKNAMSVISAIDAPKAADHHVANARFQPIRTVTEVDIDREADWVAADPSSMLIFAARSEEPSVTMFAPSRQPVEVPVGRSPAAVDYQPRQLPGLREQLRGRVRVRH